MAENSPEEALKFGLKGYEFAKLAQAFWDQERATRLISEIYEKLGNYEKALLYSRLNKTHSDSLYNEVKTSEISYHILKSTEAEKESLEQEKLISIQRAKNSRYMVIGLCVILILLVLVLILNRRWLNQKEALNRQLKQLNDEKTKLFSILTHDLKAPINSIKQVLELQELNLLTEDERINSNQLLLNQVRKTTQMMDQLLRWSQSQLKGIVTEKEQLDLVQLIHNIIEQHELMALKKKIQVHFNPLTDSPQIFADKTHLQIILQNCLQNALKFSETGGNIYLEVEDTTNHLRLSIIDEGVGMTPQKLKEIRENQTMIASTEGTNNERGTGLGLFLVKQFLEKNNGHLSIESELNKGTILKLTFEKVS
jgi:signal transduction histidine kinase